MEGNGDEAHALDGLVTFVREGHMEDAQGGSQATSSKHASASAGPADASSSRRTQNFAPMVALRLMPDMAASWEVKAHSDSREQATEQSASRSHSRRQGKSQASAAGVQEFEYVYEEQQQSSEPGPAFYQAEWMDFCLTQEPPPPLGSATFSYAAISQQRFPTEGQPHPESVIGFQQRLIDGVTFEVLHEGVPPSQNGPRRLPTITENIEPRLGPYGEPEEVEVERAAALLLGNRKAVAMMERDAVKMRNAVPGQVWYADEPFAGAGVPKPPAEEVLLAFAKLTIQVICALALPETDVLGTCDPFVVASVVDGDPMSWEAERYGADWYAKRQQWQGVTATIINTKAPRWNASFDTQVKCREDTHVHFRIYDREQIAKRHDPLGHAAVPLAEVIKEDTWAHPRPIALIPLPGSRLSRKDLEESRLLVCINFEPVTGSVRTAVPRFAAESAASSTQRRGHGRSASKDGPAAQAQPSSLSGSAEIRGPQAKAGAWMGPHSVQAPLRRVKG